MANITNDKLKENLEIRYNNLLLMVKRLEKKVKEAMKNDELTVESKANGIVSSPVVRDYLNALKQLDALTKTIKSFNEKSGDEVEVDDPTLFRQRVMNK